MKNQTKTPQYNKKTNYDTYYGGEYTHCGCGIYLCKRRFVRYSDMSYNELLVLATDKKYISHTEYPKYLDLVHMLSCPSEF